MTITNTIDLAESLWRRGVPMQIAIELAFRRARVGVECQALRKEAGQARKEGEGE